MLNTTQKIYIFARRAVHYKAFDTEAYTYYKKIALNETDYNFTLVIPPRDRTNWRRSSNETGTDKPNVYRFTCQTGKLHRNTSPSRSVHAGAELAR
ncbi:hypothetical protein MTO96_046706 [Rhipicephalus appendiculatus]